MSEFVPIPARRFSSYRRLFSGLAGHLCIDSVIEGYTPGYLYVDDEAAPGCGLLWNRADGIYLAGKASDETAEQLNRLLRQALIPDAAQRGIPVFTVTTDVRDWRPFQERLLAGLNARIIERRQFQFTGQALDPSQGLSDEMRIARVNQALFSNPALVNYRDMLGWVLSFWRSPQEFTRHGLGFAVLDGDTLASWSLSVFVGQAAYDNKQVELCVATPPAYRRRGLASLAAAACVQHCLEQGYQLHWHCDVENPGSAQVAERVGFERMVDRSAWRIHF